ncbi:MAG TPA: anti-sigma factor [Solirubrobacterales bacterium]|jgi:anti-sigma-K factor RskA|nr:anti-sigma factor [Solirubrobacterales bacterium]
MSGSDHTQWSEDLAAYMLGALDPDETAGFERHLEGCERCQAEVRWFEPAVQLLPESVERAEPPPRLREALMAEVRGDVRSAERPAPARRKSWFLKPAMGFAVLALLVAGVVGYELGRDGSGGGNKTIERQIGGIGVKMVRDGDGGTLHLSNVRQLPRGKVLEAWVLREGKVEPVPALFVPDHGGNAETTIADMSGVAEVMVTQEPRGGSEQPTSKPIVALNLQ